MTPTDPPLTPELRNLDAAYAAFKEATDQLDQKLERCLHARGPWPTEADYKVWTDAVDALHKAGLAPLDEAADDYVR